MPLKIKWPKYAIHDRAEYSRQKKKSLFKACRITVQKFLYATTAVRTLFIINLRRNNFRGNPKIFRISKTFFQLISPPYKGNSANGT